MKVYGILKEKNKKNWNILHWSSSTHESCKEIPLLLVMSINLEKGTINPHVAGQLNYKNIQESTPQYFEMLKYLYKNW